MSKKKEIKPKKSVSKLSKNCISGASDKELKVEGKDAEEDEDEEEEDSKDDDSSSEGDVDQFAATMRAPLVVRHGGFKIILILVDGTEAIGGGEDDEENEDKKEDSGADKKKKVVDQVDQGEQYY
jgi:hypothetical protein